MTVISGIFLCLVCIALCGAWAVAGANVEKALEETIRSSLSLDFNMYNEDEDLYVLIINQQGYEICKGMANWQRVDQIRCTFSTDILSPGVNKFDISVYSPKNKVLVLKSTVDFNYEPKPTSPFSQAIGVVKDSVLCRGGNCYGSEISREGKRDPLKKLLIVSGVIATVGVLESIVFGQVLRVFQSLAAIFRPQPPQAPLPVVEIAPPTDSSPPPAPDNDFGSSPPDLPHVDMSHEYRSNSNTFLHTRPPSRLSAVLQNAKRSMRRVTANRQVKLALFVCMGLALMHQDTVHSILTKSLPATVIPTRSVTNFHSSPSTLSPQRPQVQEAQKKVPTKPTQASTPPSAIYQVSPSVRRQLEEKIAQNDFEQKQQEQQQREKWEQQQQQQRQKDLAIQRADASTGKAVLTKSQAMWIRQALGTGDQRPAAATRIKLPHIHFKHLIVHMLTHHIPECTKHVTIRNAARLVNEGIVPRWVAMRRMLGLK